MGVGAGRVAQYSYLVAPLYRGDRVKYGLMVLIQAEVGGATSLSCFREIRPTPSITEGQKRREGGVYSLLFRVARAA